MAPKRFEHWTTWAGRYIPVMSRQLSRASVVQVECEVKDEEEVDVECLMERLRHHVLVNRIRVKEFFRDFDALNSGSVTRARFERGVSCMGLSSLGQHHLTGAQLAALCHIYEDPSDPRRIAWTRFADDLETVFTLPHLEYTPSVQARSVVYVNCNSTAPFTRYNLLSNRLYRVNGV